MSSAHFLQKTLGVEIPQSAGRGHCKQSLAGRSWIAPTSITSTSAAWITSCIGRRFERIYEAVAGKRREGTSVIAASQNGRLVAPLTFAGTCTRKWWTRILPKCCCRPCRRAVSSCWTMPGFTSPRPPPRWLRPQAATCFSPSLLARSQPHRTPLGRPQDPPAERPLHRHQPRSFYWQYLPVLLLIAKIPRGWVWTHHIAIAQHR